MNNVEKSIVSNSKLIALSNSIKLKSGAKGELTIDQMKVEVDSLPAKNSIITEKLSGVEYQKQLDANTLDFGFQNKVGGMTYKSENLLNIESGLKDNFTKIGTNLYQLEKTSTNRRVEMLTNIPSNTEFTISYNTELSTNGVPIRFWNKDKIIGDTALFTEYGTDGSQKTHKYNEPITKIDIYISNDQPDGTKTILNELQINLGGVKKPFEPYYLGLHDSPVDEVVSEGRNILDIESGLSANFTKIGNNLYQLEKTSPNDRSFNIDCEIPANTEFTFSFSKKVNFSCVIRFFYENGDVTSDRIFNNIFEKYTYKFAKKIIRVNSYISIDKPNGAKVIYPEPQINLGNKALPFTPYIKPLNYLVPTPIKQLEGYGKGVNQDCYNYIDYDRKVFVQRVKEIILNGSENWYTNTIGRFAITLGVKAINTQNINQISTWNDLNAQQTYKKIDGISCNGGQIHIWKTDIQNDIPALKQWLQANPIKVIYILEVPIETDISQYLPNITDNVIKVQGGGTITFENQYKNKVPFEITTQKELK